MKRILYIILTIFLLFSYQNIFSQSYEIKIKINNIKNQDVIIGHYWGSSSQLIADDTVKVNNKGEGTFKGDNLLPQGMYFLFLPNKSYFNIIVGQDQKFTIINDTIPEDYVKNLKSKGSLENEIFANYQVLLENSRKKANELKNKKQKIKDKEKLKEINAQLIQIDKNIKTAAHKLINDNPDFFFSKFLKATMQIEIPENIKDRSKQFHYRRNQYFKQFDYTDARLIRSPIFDNKLDYYLDNFIYQMPDTIISVVDSLINISRKDRELFKYMMVHLFNKYVTSEIMGMENVYVHIADKYYIKEAYWSNREFIADLEKKVVRIKPGLIGKIAPDIRMIKLPDSKEGLDILREKSKIVKENGIKLKANEEYLDKKYEEYRKLFPLMKDSALQAQVKINELAQIVQDDFIPDFEGYLSLHNIKSKFIIIWFWEYTCSHCKKLTPELSKAYDTEKLQEKGVTVFAVHLNKRIDEWNKYIKNLNGWFDFVEKHDMHKFINVWEPFGTSNFRDKYNISSSPILYLLDENKEIIAKKIGHKQAIRMINDILENEKKQ